MRILNFHQTTPEAGDCTACYEVTTGRKHRGRTVEELINIILKEQPNDYGNVDVKLVERNGAFVKNIFVAKYSHGKCEFGEAFEAYKNRRVHHITSHGGWTAMDYEFYVYMKETL